MEKIILENHSDLNTIDAMKVFSHVIEMGRISNFGKEYCYATTYKIKGYNYFVFSHNNKKSDRLVLRKE